MGFHKTSGIGYEAYITCVSKKCIEEVTNGITCEITGDMEIQDCGDICLVGVYGITYNSFKTKEYINMKKRFGECFMDFWPDIFSEKDEWFVILNKEYVDFVANKYNILK